MHNIEKRQVQTYHYDCYGLKIGANRRLTGLMEASFRDRPDIFVTCQEHRDEIDRQDFDWRPFNGAGMVNADSIRTVWAAERNGVSYLRLHFQSPVDTEFIRFDIDPIIDRIRVVWTSKCNTISDAVSLLMQPVLGAVLRLRGTLCLHAGVLRIGNEAIALAGSSGAGKSTTIMALANHNYSVVSDEMATITKTKTKTETPCVLSSGLSHPTVRLCDGAANQIADFLEVPPPWTRLLPVEDKRYFLPTLNKQVTEPVPLKGIYILSPRSSSHGIHIERLSGPKAMIALLPHTFARWVLNEKQKTLEFAQIGELVRRIPIFAVERPDDIARLSELATRIGEHAARL